MRSLIELKSAVKYNTRRTQSNTISIENFVTTDNVLQNKAGITLATNLPPQGSSMPAFEKNNILVANIRPYLKKIWFADRDGGCSADVLVFEVNKKFDPKYVYYSMFRDDFFDHVMHGSKGTKMPRGDKNQILDFLIPDFNITTQKQIANLLSSLDSKIALNNRINAELEAMAKTLYDYWFVQFDFPVSAAIEGETQSRTLNNHTQSYKSSGGKMVWNEELKREVPEGWKVKALMELSNQIGDGIHGTPQYIENSDYNFINGNNLKNGFVQTIELTKKVTQAEYEKYYIELNGDSILLSINGTLGNLAVYTNEKVILGKSSAYINCKSNHRAFCYLFLKQEQIQKLFWNIATGSTIKNLSLASLKDLKLVYPGIEIVNRFDKLIKPIDHKRENIFKENQQLSSLRDWLLPMLMNGQVKVGEVQTT